ncbi:L-serine ammonia-lyase, iron-sulfur-dependent subunit beta [Clostridium massiliamazoniense]|uniref:L-serine ammonia-lyase, iron-sulfur-dependent subunit beta n=1 Tax=Clostridium massiliamazoniense TaxID=1347366 RepID=UPI0006D76EAF|nr:L-serine ammonia-lyase, iron-sulfur-dependent subunit beta [Clostridium massiliamazoniense]
MNNVCVFDILGPIMVGPSSSHTAGAARLGKVARAVAGEKIVDVKFLLHGSFAKTYKGHGTDKALLAGILGMQPDDERLRASILIAKKEGLNFEFIERDLGDYHPNTVKFIMTGESGKVCEVLGSSIGGGSIEIVEVNGKGASFTGAYPTLITCHDDKFGTVNKVTSILCENEVNIAFMNVSRTQKGMDATMTLEIDSKIDEAVIKKIEEIDGINKVILINIEEDGE